MKSGLICQRSGKEFSLSSVEKKAYSRSDIPLPGLSPFEQLRNLLACVPSLEVFSLEEGMSFSTDDGMCSMKIPSFRVSESGNWIPVLEASSGDTLMRESSSEPHEFMNQFVGLFKEYLSEQDTKPKERYPAHYFCRSMVHSLDCFSCENLKNSFECVSCTNSENIFFSRNSHFCSHSYFLDSCQNCTHCIFCFGLKDAEYQVFNSPVSKEEYERMLQEVALYSPVRLESARERFSNFLLAQPVPAVFELGSSEASGNYIYFSKNIDPGLLVFNSRDSSLLLGAFEAENLVAGAFTGPGVSDSIFSMLMGGDVKKSHMVYASGGVLNACEYCIACENCEYLFGCVGLKGKSYCILNRQYEEKEYFRLRNGILEYLKNGGGWGNIDIFRTMILPYNLSLANIFMPLGRIQAHLFGHIWKEETSNVSALRFASANDDFLVCEISGVPFQFSDYEREFSSEFKIAIPERSPVQRFKERLESCNFSAPGEHSCPFSSTKINSWYGGSRTVIGNKGFESYRQSK